MCSWALLTKILIHFSWEGSRNLPFKTLQVIPMQAVHWPYFYKHWTILEILTHLSSLFISFINVSPVSGILYVLCICLITEFVHCMINSKGQKYWKQWHFTCFVQNLRILWNQRSKLSNIFPYSDSVASVRVKLLVQWVSH